MSDLDPAALIGQHIEALMRGEPLPTPAGAEAELLRQAVRCLLASEAYPRTTAALRNQLSLRILSALSRRMAADIRAARAIGQARGT